MDTPAERLRARIARHGPIPFAEFMEEALYGEGGYYAGPRPAIGPAGDFVTGSSLSPLFGRSTATLLARLAARLGTADLLEAGFGDGRHLGAVRQALPADHAGRLLAWDRVARPVPEGVVALTDLGPPSARPLTGVVFSYELFDALPVHRLVRAAGGAWRELWVDLEPDGRFGWRQLSPAGADPRELLGSAAEAVEEGQVVDLAPGWGPLYESLAACLDRGLLVTCDYGFDRRRLIDPRVRRYGTLACYRRQTVHRDPFAEVGRQDLTAHVDFSTLAEAGERAGLETVGLVSQAEWLGACGVFDGLESADRATRLEAARLLDPAGMGSDIKVLIQARGVEPRGLFDLDVARSLTPLRPPVE